jgi:hypothetical protein
MPSPLALVAALILAAGPVLAQGIQPVRPAAPSAPPAPAAPAVRPAAPPPPPGFVQPAPEQLLPAPATLQAGAWTYQAQEDGGRRFCVLTGRNPEGAFLVLRVVQNYGPDVTLMNPAWRLRGDRLGLRVTIGPVSKDLSASLPTPQQLRADLVADAEAFADLLEAAETLDVPVVQAAVPGQRPAGFAGQGLREAAARFGDCIETLHGRRVDPGPGPRR